ncbi:Serine-threonine/tyrosine-protein kinase, catalytic domain [Dillenia turbinata]|uniref:Serine-threonine/tyrosine-protein kinase, catalytic domain n=1 Tax=Dillenia turbinata TaxID=194707 RepID=A0AAN8ZP78_9MAGN
MWTKNSLGAGTAAIVAVVLWFTIQHRANKRKRLLEMELVSEGRELRIEYSFLRKVAGVPTKFRYKEIEEATDDFKGWLGEGASASVFKGILNDGTSIAVKRIDGEERGEKEFKSEVAAIASVQHVNLVRLLGYCIVPGGPRYLWLLEHGVSEKCDVYSYGMVLLEMIGGRRNVRLVEKGMDKSQRKWQYFPKMVFEKNKEGKLMEVLDQRLIEGGGVEEKQVKTLVYTAFWCIQERARLRPTMARVVEMLEGRAPVDEPPDSSMSIVGLLSTDDDSHEVNQPRLGTVTAHQMDNGTPSNSTYSFTLSTLSGR